MCDFLDQCAHHMEQPAVTSQAQCTAC
jgi:hypothetical protein